MANTFLNVGNSNQENESVKDPEKYFKIQNLLGEIADAFPDDLESAKEQLRNTIGAISYNDVFDSSNEEDHPPFITRITNLVNPLINEAIENVNSITLEELEKILERYVEKTPNPIFESVRISPNKSFSNFGNNEVVTKDAIEDNLKTQLKDSETIIKNWTKDILKQYYTQDKVYDKESIDDSLNKAIDNAVSKALYEVKNNLSGFAKPISGKSPQSMSDLTTKRWVEERVLQHENDFDAHNIKKKLDKLVEDYTRKIAQLKGETYTASEIDKIVSDLVKSQIKQKLAEFPTFNDLDSIKRDLEEYYIKFDGTTPFYKPQSGKDAENPEHLVTLKQLNELRDELSERVEKQQCYWVTSGNVETTVGFFEDNSRTPEKMTMQEVLDRIFYQKRISIDTPETVNPGSYVDVTVCVSDPSDVDYAEILVKENGEWVRAKRNNIEVAAIEREEFEEFTCVTREVGPIYEDTKFDFRIYQSNNDEHNEYTDTKITYPVFVGYIPKWLPGNQVKYSHLLKQSESDKENNVFYEKTKYMREVEHTYNFDLEDPVKLIIAVPMDYRDLHKVQNNVQTFGIQDFETDKFDKVYQTTFLVGKKDVLYKLYIYKQPLVRFNSDVIFKFR